MQTIKSKRLWLGVLLFPMRASTQERAQLSHILQENMDLAILAMLALILPVILAFFLLSRRTRRKLRRLAFFDRLTGLPTMEKFRIDAAQRLKQAKNGEYTLFYVDIDNFKYINDTFGYATGDRVLAAIADHFREFSQFYVLSGRISADNFMFLATTVPPQVCAQQFEEIGNVAHHLEKIVPEYFHVSFSVGYYVIENPTEDFSTLLDKSNTARKQGKETQLNSLTEYTARMHEDMRWRREMTLSMNAALESREFHAYFQPKFDLNTERMVGAEALVRWVRPGQGVLQPGVFVPFFEKNGFIRKLDYFMMDEVCRLLAKWKSEKKAVIPISVNLSRNHLHNPRVAEDIRLMAQKHGVSSSLIEMELTESIVFDNSEQLVSIMNEIRAAGFSISIDDFGSGYSSLNLLADLPADVLKIDKGFVDRATATNHGGKIIRKVIELAKSISLVTVAEGIETEVQASMLREMGCDIAQGYYYAKPMPAEQFASMLESTTPEQ